LQRTEQQASARQHQLERYAADLREVFKQERSRAQELRENYKATVRALSNAVEARDAYTGKHASA
jgi:ribonuclease P protein subunit RPR2